MNSNELNQIIFNALETERSHTRSEEYRKKVDEAIKQHRSKMEEERPAIGTGCCGCDCEGCE